MYLQHYRLRQMPFEIGPNPKFLWGGESYKEAVAILKYGILKSKGFVVLIGEPGMGKTTLLNAVAAGSSSNIRFARIAEPSLNEMDFLNFTASALGMDRTFDSKADFLMHLQTFVSETGARSEKVVLVIDEAQRLTPDLLEQIRILANFDGPDQKAFSCIFAGQNEFLTMVKQNKALSQRVFRSHTLLPLTEAETEAYIAHRLMVAGAEEPIFTSSAMRAVHKLAEGKPRLINSICDKAMLAGYANFLREIGPDIVRKCAEETLIPFEAAPESKEEANPEVLPDAIEPQPEAADAQPDSDPRRSAPGSLVPNRKAAYLGLAVALVLIGAIYGYYSGAFDKVLSSAGPPSNSSETSRNVVEKARSPQTAAKTEAVAGPSEIVQLQGRLLELRNQNGELEERLKAFQARFDAYKNDRRELEAAQARIVELEKTVDIQNKDLTAAGQKIAELEESLVVEKRAMDRANADLASRQAAIMDMQKHLDAARDLQQKRETPIQTTVGDKGGPQSPPREVKASKPATQPVPVGTPEVGPDPTRVIDFVIKQKSQPPAVE